ncbi:alpha-galactosidase [Streptomyces sp. Ncost-T10-10d]|uniref:alpha-galactosidase n=1 Tax=Streptomyces sp. Ncost-T10-10d TaxID=1839774 RepID=UPI00081F3BBE|nr:alpha-galactosidase [Streptomyces sp. Ncost-T10-10d]SCF81479.1 alpha-galactosidase [Streptomyces sp. Ncost-T10-10d]
MSRIFFDAASHTLLLTTPATSYALRIDAEGAPRHLHWGAPLTVEQATALPTYDGLTSSFASTSGEEINVEGGPRFGVPSLLVRYANGARGVEWHYEGHEITDGSELHIHLRDQHYPLGCTLHYAVHDDSDIIERSLTVRHLGTADEDGPIEMLRCDAAVWSIPSRSGTRMTHTVGQWTGETQLRRTEAPYAETTFTSRRGVSGHFGNPWLMVDAGDATETHGDVWSTVLAWSGSWRITAHRDHTGGPFTVAGGGGHDGISRRIQPGESHRTPVFAGQFSQGGFGAASRGWHAYIANHVLPHPDEPRPVIYNSWEATGWHVTPHGQRALADRAADLGVELFVVDDGWFGQRTNDRAGLGDWHPNPEHFPDGLGPLVDLVRRLGMGFGLWVEPEMTNPDSDLYRRHPDWVLHMPHRRRTELRHQLVLNFAREDVTEWAYKWLDRLVAQHTIDYLKWDMNRAFTEAGWPGHPDGERLWTDHTRGVYAVIDRLRHAHPGLRIEGCAGGGGRADLGMLARTDQTWISDNTDAVDRITIQHGYSQIYPARTMSAWVTDSPNPHTGRTTPLPYRFHIAMTGALGIGGDLSHWSQPELDEARELVALYKSIRPVVQFGRQYRLEDAVQYMADDRLVVIAWGHDRDLPLNGLSLDDVYVDELTGAEHHAANLLTRGLPLHLGGGDRPSAVVRLTKQ